MFLDSNFPFQRSYNVHTIVGLVLGATLSFILIVLEPFGTANFKHEYRNALLLGYGLLSFIMYLMAHAIEVIPYNRDKIWNWGREITFQVLFGICSIIITFIYQEYMINKQPLSLTFFLGFLFYIALPIFPLLALPTLLLRYVLIKNSLDKHASSNNHSEIPLKQTYIEFKGESQADVVVITRTKLVYVASVENYVKIYYLEGAGVKNAIIRSTLASIKEQADFLWQPHRSYLINLSQDFVLKGNSQKSYLILDGMDMEIPVARSSYSKLKNKLQSVPKA